MWERGSGGGGGPINQTAPHTPLPLPPCPSSSVAAKEEEEEEKRLFHCIVRRFLAALCFFFAKKEKEKSLLGLNAGEKSAAVSPVSSAYNCFRMNEKYKCLSSFGNVGNSGVAVQGRRRQQINGGYMTKSLFFLTRTHLHAMSVRMWTGSV